MDSFPSLKGFVIDPSSSSSSSSSAAASPSSSAYASPAVYGRTRPFSAHSEVIPSRTLQPSAFTPQNDRSAFSHTLPLPLPSSLPSSLAPLLPASASATRQHHHHHHPHHSHQQQPQQQQQQQRDLAGASSLDSRPSLSQTGYPPLLTRSDSLNFTNRTSFDSAEPSAQQSAILQPRSALDLPPPTHIGYGYDVYGRPLQMTPSNRTKIMGAEYYQSTGPPRGTSQIDPATDEKAARDLRADQFAMYYGTDVSPPPHPLSPREKQYLSTSSYRLPPAAAPPAAASSSRAPMNIAHSYDDQFDNDDDDAVSPLTALDLSYIDDLLAGKPFTPRGGHRSRVFSVASAAAPQPFRKSGKNSSSAVGAGRPPLHVHTHRAQQRVVPASERTRPLPSSDSLDFSYLDPAKQMPLLHSHVPTTASKPTLHHSQSVRPVRSLDDSRFSAERRGGDSGTPRMTPSSLQAPFKRSLSATEGTQSRLLQKSYVASTSPKSRITTATNSPRTSSSRLTAATSPPRGRAKLRLDSIPQPADSELVNSLSPHSSTTVHSSDDLADLTIQPPTTTSGNLTQRQQEHINQVAARAARYLEAEAFAQQGMAEPLPDGLPTRSNAQGDRLVVSAAEMKSHEYAQRAVSLLSQEKDREVVYCLEVFVNYLEDVVDPSTMASPAVAFRLLDFPTIMVYATSTLEKAQLQPHELKSLESKAKDEQQQQQQQSQNSNTIDFNRGRSVLFRLQPAVLADLLSRVPLYAMLVDVQDPANARLLGSTSIDLSSFVQTGVMPVRETARGYRSGRFVFVDLMGREVAAVAMLFRLSCLGDALLSHLNVLQALNREKEAHRLAELENRRMGIVLPSFEESVAKLRSTLSNLSIPLPPSIVSRQSTLQPPPVIGSVFPPSQLDHEHHRHRHHQQHQQQSSAQPPSPTRQPMIAQTGRSVSPSGNQTVKLEPPSVSPRQKQSQSSPHLPRADGFDHKHNHFTELDEEEPLEDQDKNTNHNSNNASLPTSSSSGAGVPTGHIDVSKHLDVREYLAGAWPRKDAFDYQPPPLFFSKAVASSRSSNSQAGASAHLPSPVAQPAQPNAPPIVVDQQILASSSASVMSTARLRNDVPSAAAVVETYAHAESESDRTRMAELDRFAAFVGAPPDVRISALPPSASLVPRNAMLSAVDFPASSSASGSSSSLVTKSAQTDVHTAPVKSRKISLVANANTQTETDSDLDGPGGQLQLSLDEERENEEDQNNDEQKRSGSATATLSSRRLPRSQFPAGKENRHRLTARPIGEAALNELKSPSGSAAGTLRRHVRSPSPGGRSSAAVPKNRERRPSSASSSIVEGQHKSSKVGPTPASDAESRGPSPNGQSQVDSAVSVASSLSSTSTSPKSSTSDSKKAPSSREKQKASVGNGVDKSKLPSTTRVKTATPRAGGAVRSAAALPLKKRSGVGGGSVGGARLSRRPSAESLKSAAQSSSSQQQPQPQEQQQKGPNLNDVDSAAAQLIRKIQERVANTELSSLSASPRHHHHHHPHHQPSLYHPSMDSSQLYSPLYPRDPLNFTNRPLPFGVPVASPIDYRTLTPREIAQSAYHAFGPPVHPATLAASRNAKKGAPARSSPSSPRDVKRPSSSRASVRGYTGASLSPQALNSNQQQQQQKQQEREQQQMPAFGGSLTGSAAQMAPSDVMNQMMMSMMMKMQGGGTSGKSKDNDTKGSSGNSEMMLMMMMMMQQQMQQQQKQQQLQPPLLSAASPSDVSLSADRSGVAGSALFGNTSSNFEQQLRLQQQQQQRRQEEARGRSVFSTSSLQPVSNPFSSLSPRALSPRMQSIPNGVSPRMQSIPGGLSPRTVPGYEVRTFDTLNGNSNNLFGSGMLSPRLTPGPQTTMIQTSDTRGGFRNSPVLASQATGFSQPQQLQVQQQQQQQPLLFVEDQSQQSQPVVILQAQSAASISSQRSTPTLLVQQQSPQQQLQLLPQQPLLRQQQPLVLSQMDTNRPLMVVSPPQTSPVQSVLVKQPQQQQQQQQQQQRVLQAQPQQQMVMQNVQQMVRPAGPVTVLQPVSSNFTSAPSRMNVQPAPLIVTSGIGSQSQVLLTHQQSPRHLTPPLVMPVPSQLRTLTPMSTPSSQLRTSTPPLVAVASSPSQRTLSPSLHRLPPPLDTTSNTRNNQFSNNLQFQQSSTRSSIPSANSNVVSSSLFDTPPSPSARQQQQQQQQQQPVSFPQPIYYS